MAVGNILEYILSPAQLAASPDSTVHQQRPKGGLMAWNDASPEACRSIRRPYEFTDVAYSGRNGSKRAQGQFK
jgi:hypothetical protein